MNLALEYSRQSSWRRWSTIFDALPSLANQSVLDLGCAVGDRAAALAERGAHVIGIDADKDLLREARSKGLTNVEFLEADLRSPFELEALVDGIWSSFAAAYFPELTPILTLWSRHLRPGGWIALTEIDDLFGHEPLSPHVRSLVDAYADEALAQQRYDFRMGRKLAAHLNASGFAVTKELILDDQELAFSGPASADVLQAWELRFDRISALRDFCGTDFDRVREEFLGCLGRPDHRSLARVCCCVATKSAR